MKHLIGNTHLLHTKAPAIRERTRQQRRQLVLGERMKHKHLAARQERAVNLKRRILCRRANQYNAALLHKRQKSVLLCLVKPMNLVHEHDCPLAKTAVLLCLLHHCADFFDSARNC